MNKYRIIEDGNGYFIVQRRRLYLFWEDVNFNPLLSLDEAYRERDRYIASDIFRANSRIKRVVE